jgi:valyl-tRNA synthetase
MAEPSESLSGAGSADNELNDSIEKLESLVEARERAARMLAGLAAAIPVLNEKVSGIDTNVFSALGSRKPEEITQPYSPPAAPVSAPAAAGAPDASLERKIRELLGEELKQVVDELKASIVAEVRQALREEPAAARAEAQATATPAPQIEAGAAPAAPAPLAKTYAPHEIERTWYERWEAAGHFAAGGAGAPYSIALPPPNVTGSLHMGHAFQVTLMDALIRYHRMAGRTTLWQGGTDHAGIATQMVVERTLAAKGVKRAELGRERFVQAVWAWKRKSGGEITRQLRRMGASLDWARERFTMDEGLSRAVTEVFVRLYDEGLLYRGKRLVNWDPVFHTAISDLEVVSEEEQGHLWQIRYPFADGSGHLIVATTRPETMLGDTAVAVHPDDERYRQFIGKHIRLPLTQRVIPVIADAHVDPAFGSGCVKITPAHDFNDYEVGQRHGLPQISIFTANASLNENAPPAYQRLDRFEARERIVADLQAQGLLHKVEEHKLMVPRGDRSHAVIEPLLTDQWYVKIAPLAESAIKAVEDGRVRFVPESWAKTYFEWMRHIKDWCISRQLWWGHRIPAWYTPDGTLCVGRDEAEARSRAGLSPEVRLEQDPDVLDTWFSSALWPFSTLGWPDETPELKTFYPTSVLVTGFDIIFFWVARMIMMGLKFAGDVPFKEVYIHGLVRDADGNKMSKSKGNILDPLDLIDGIELEPLVKKRTQGLMRPEDAPRIADATRAQFPDGIPAHGTDALRFSFAALAAHGRDIRFDLGRVKGDRNFCNKIWNAARFVLLTTESFAEDLKKGESALGTPERWIRTRLQNTIGAVQEAFAGYRFDLAAQAIYEFVWDDFCDWYLELAKVDLNDPEWNEALRRGTRRTLVDVLETALRLAHPIMPFITEEIWQRVAPLAGRDGPTIMLQPFPSPMRARVDQHSEAQLQWLKQAVLAVRRIRSENNIEPKRSVSVLTQGGNERERAWLHAGSRYIKALARVESIEPVAMDSAPESATALAGDMTLMIPLAGLIDAAEEAKRIDKELDKLRSDLTRIVAKLGNEAFVAKAPAAVVQKERARRDELIAAIDRLKAQRDRLPKA